MGRRNQPAGRALSAEELVLSRWFSRRDPARRSAGCSAAVAQQHHVRMRDLNILAPVLPLIL